VLPPALPATYRKSVLGEQLLEMRTWPPSLKESPNPALNAYGDILITQVEAADEALKLVSAAEQRNEDFRTLGERKQFFDKVNGLRKLLHGEVSKMVHDHPEWNLTRDYVDALFEHDTAPSEPSDTDLERKIEAAGAEHTRLIAMREQRIRAEQLKVIEAAEAEKKAKLAAIEAAEKVAAEASAKIAALKAELSPASL
jgi:hypothetical protein